MDCTTTYQRLHYETGSTVTVKLHSGAADLPHRTGAVQVNGSLIKGQHLAIAPLEGQLHLIKDSKDS